MAAERKINVEEAVKLYVEEKWSTFDLGKKYNCAPNNVEKALKKRGIEMRGVKIKATPAIKTKIIAWYESGLSAPEIEKRYGAEINLDESTIYRVISKAGVSRTIKEAKAIQHGKD